MIQLSDEKKRFLLRLDQDLYDQLSHDADKAHRSINAHIEAILQKAVQGTSFERRQIVGQVVNGRQISPDTGLVTVAGIYYRYLISDNSVADTTAQYAVIDAVGNILTLQKL